VNAFAPITPADPHALAAIADELVGAVADRWDETPEARTLIIQAIASDLRPTIRTATYAVTRDEWREYEGPIADALEDLRWEWLQANHKPGQRDGTPYQRTVAEAIDHAAMTDVPAVAVRALEPDARLLSILRVERDLTADERAYVDACERAAA